MAAPDPRDGEQLADLGCVFGVNEQIRAAVAELENNPLSPDIGMRVRYLLGEPATKAREALTRLNSGRRGMAAAPALSVVPPLPSDEEDA